jgi:hypothetical protein
VPGVETRHNEIAKRYGSVLSNLAPRKQSLKDVLKDVSSYECLLKNLRTGITS